MTPQTAAKQWIKDWRSKETLEEGFVDFEANERVNNWVREDADRGLQVINGGSVMRKQILDRAGRRVRREVW